MTVPRFLLQRLTGRPDGAQGVWLHEDRGPAPLAFAVGLERTYDAPPLPCCHRLVSGQYVKIPPGVYDCPRDFYAKGGYWTYAVPVAGHTEIKIHKANLETQLEGCPAIAESFHVWARPDLGLVGPGVADGRGAFAEFLRRAAGAPRIVLEVRDPT